MDISYAFVSLGIAVGLGLLIGLQRERTESGLAGVRTYPIIAAAGCLSALGSPEFGPWLVAAALLAVAGVTVTGMLIRVRISETGPGVTSEMAILLMFVLGAMSATGMREVAVVMGGALAVLLHAKEALHRFTERLGEKDVRAVMTFVLIALVILPVLPDETYGPFDALNPREVWTVVVLVVAINFGGYLAHKLLPGEAGVAAAGVIGGMISSTATTISAARRAKAGGGAHVRAAAAIVVLASTVMFVRVLIEVWVVAPGFLGVVAGPAGVMLVTLGSAGALAWALSRRDAEAIDEPTNPTELRPAVLFGLAYAAVLFAVAAAQHVVGYGGVYGVAAVSGTINMDAITLSTSRMVERGEVAAGVGWRAILLASMANLLCKIAVVQVIAGWRTAWRVGALFLAAILVGLALVLFWPDGWVIGGAAPAGAGGG